MPRINRTNPLTRLLSRTATDRIQINIIKAVPADPVVTAATIFRGWITGAEFDGPFVTADVAGFGSLFSRSVPRTLMQTGDNYALFDAGNRLDRAQWTFTARLTGVAGNVLTFDTLTWPQGALPSIPDNYFALGYIERPTNFERIPLVSSTAIAAGVVTVTLAHGFTNPAPAPPEAGWHIVPGYDGLFDTANTKFNNTINFGGFPQIPDTNPSLVPVPTNQPTGSKK